MRTWISLLALALLVSLLASQPLASAAQVGQEEQKPVQYLVQFRVLDAEGRPLDGAKVEALNATDQELIADTIVNETGWACLWLPNGSTCDIRVIWMDAVVGSLENLTVLSNMTLPPLNCSVCDLAFLVRSELGEALMNVKLTVELRYLDEHGNVTRTTKELTTNETGACELERTLMEANYTIRAYRHGLPKPFYTAQLHGLNGSLTLNITCPLMELVVCLVDEQMAPVEGAEVEAYDWGTGRLMGSATTDGRGLARLRVLFGYCLLKVSVGGRLVAEEKVAVQEDPTWYYLTYERPELTLKVVVRDLLGSPVPGLRLKLVGPGGEVVEGETGADGSAIFKGLGKGAYRLEVYRGGELLAVRSFLLTRSGSLEVRLEDRVLLLGNPVWTPHLLASLSAALTALGAALAIFLWRRLPIGRAREEQGP